MPNKATFHYDYTQGVKRDSTCKVPQISDIMQGSQMLQEPDHLIQNLHSR